MFLKKILFFTVLLIFGIGLSFVAKSENTPKLICDKNGDFTILIVSDPQCDTKAQWQEAKQELEILVQKSDPDFVLINGDMNSNNNIPADMWDMFISPLTRRDIYWSTTNGNHDPFTYRHYRMYQKYQNCLNETVSTVDINYEPSRPMNYCLPVYSNDGKRIVFAIYGMDSGDCGENGYEGLTQRQINWYKNQSEILKQKNGGQAVTSVLCMHIPLPQILEMYYSGDYAIYGVANEIKYNTKGYICQNGKQISKINIHTSNPDTDNKMFDAILSGEDIKGVFFGHDHRNNFIGSYKGVLLGFVGKLSTGCYSDALCRGGRVVKFNQSEPQKFTTEWLGSIETSKDQPAIYSDGTMEKQLTTN